MRLYKDLMAVIRTFSDADYTVQVYTTRARRDATRFMAEHGNEFDTVVAGGGDGTLNEVVTGALQSGFKGILGFIPCGTTNDLGETLGLPKDPVQAAELIARGEAKDLDFGRLNGELYFTYVASFGAFTEVSYSTNQKFKNAFGHLAYILQGVASVGDVKPYRMKITCNGKVYEDEFLFGGAVNSRSIAGIVKLPKERVDLCDGMHEVLLVKNPKNAAKLAVLLKDIIAGVLEGEDLIFLRSDRILFEAEEEVPWCIDGEFAGDHRSVLLENIHGKQKIVMP